MLSTNSCFDQNFNTPQCCLIPFFSQGLTMSRYQQGNTHGIVDTKEII